MKFIHVALNRGWRIRMSIIHENKLPGDNLYNFVRDVADACSAGGGRGNKTNKRNIIIRLLSHALCLQDSKIVRKTFHYNKFPSPVYLLIAKSKNSLGGNEKVEKLHKR